MQTLVIIGLVVLLVMQAKKKSKSKNPFVIFHAIVRGIAKSIAFLWNIWCYYFYTCARIVMETYVALEPQDESNIRLAWDVFVAKRFKKKLPKTKKYERATEAYLVHARKWCETHNNMVESWAAGLGIMVLIVVITAALTLLVMKAHGKI